MWFAPRKFADTKSYRTSLIYSDTHYLPNNNDLCSQCEHSVSGQNSRRLWRTYNFLTPYSVSEDVHLSCSRSDQLLLWRTVKRTEDKRKELTATMPKALLVQNMATMCTGMTHCTATVMRSGIHVMTTIMTVSTVETTDQQQAAGTSQWQGHRRRPWRAAAPLNEW